MACIVVVDDNLACCRTLTRLLAQAGHAAVYLLSGHAALQSLLGSPPDLLVLDLHLGDMDGLELLERLRGHRQLSALPVVILSGVMDLEVQRRACALGAADYILKGLDWRDMLRRIERHLPRAVSSPA